MRLSIMRYILLLLFVRIFAYRRLLFVRTSVAVSSVASTIGLIQCLSKRP